MSQRIIRKQEDIDSGKLNLACQNKSFESKLENLKIPEIDFGKFDEFKNHLNEYKKELEAEENVRKKKAKELASSLYSEFEESTLCRGKERITFVIEGVEYKDNISYRRKGYSEDIYIDMRMYMCIANHIGDIMHNYVIREWRENTFYDVEPSIKFISLASLAKVAGSDFNLCYCECDYEIYGKYGRKELKIFINKHSSNDKDQNNVRIIRKEKDMHEKKIEWFEDLSLEKQLLDFIQFTSNFKQSYIKELDILCDIANKRFSKYYIDQDDINNKETYNAKIIINGYEFPNITIYNKSFIKLKDFKTIINIIGDPFGIFESSNCNKYIDLEKYIISLKGSYEINKLELQAKNKFVLSNFIKHNIEIIIEINKIHMCQTDEEINFCKNCFNSLNTTLFVNQIIEISEKLFLYRKKINNLISEIANLTFEKYKTLDYIMSSGNRFIIIRNDNNSLVFNSLNRKIDDFIQLLEFLDDIFYKFYKPNYYTETFDLGLYVSDRIDNFIVDDSEKFIGKVYILVDGISKYSYKEKQFIERITNQLDYIDEILDIYYSIFTTFELLFSYNEELIDELKSNRRFILTLGEYTCIVGTSKTGSTLMNELFLDTNFEISNMDKMFNDSLIKLSISNGVFLNLSDYLNYTENGNRLIKNGILIEPI